MGRIQGDRYNAILNLLLHQSTAAELKSPAVQTAASLLSQKNAQGLLLPHAIRQVFKEVISELTTGHPKALNEQQLWPKVFNVFLLTNPAIPPRSSENIRIERRNKGIQLNAYYKQMQLENPHFRSEASQRAQDIRREGVRKRALPLVEKIREYLQQRLDYPEIARKLNEAGLKTVGGRSFNRFVVQDMVKTYELTGRQQFRKEEKDSTAQKVHELMSGFPYETSEITKQKVTEIRMLQEILGEHGFRELVLTNPNASFLHEKKIVWRGILPPAIDAVKDILVSPTPTGQVPSNEDEPKAHTLLDLVKVLLRNHPGNGIQYKHDIKDDIVSELQALFELFHHPYATLITSYALDSLIDREELEDLLLPAAPKPREVYTAPNKRTVLLSRVQRLFDKNRKYEFVTTLLNRAGIDAPESALKRLVSQDVLTYTPGEIDRKVREKRNADFFEDIAELQAIRRSILGTPAENRDENYWEVFTHFLNEVMNIKAQKDVVPLVTAKYGAVNGQILEAMETGLYPDHDLTILGSERFRNDYYMVLTPETMAYVEALYGAPNVELRNENQEITAYAVNIGALTEAVAKVLLTKGVKYPNQDAFYIDLADALREICILDVQPYADSIDAESLATSFIRRHRELHDQIPTWKLFWVQKIFIGAEGSLGLSISDVLKRSLKIYTNQKGPVSAIQHLDFDVFLDIFEAEVRKETVRPTQALYKNADEVIKAALADESKFKNKLRKIINGEA